MEKWLEWIGGATAWAVTLWMAKVFIEEKVFDAIKEAKKISNEAKESNVSLHEEVKSAYVAHMTRISELDKMIYEQLHRQMKLFQDAVEFSNQAKKNAFESLEKFKSLEETTDSNARKFAKLGTAIVQELKSTKTDVKNLNNNLILLKTKVEKKDD